MAENCIPQVQACRLRAAVLEDDGVPLPGASNLYVSDALVSLTATPVYEDGDEINEKNGCGDELLNFKGQPTIRRVDIEINLLTPDPYLSAILSSGGALLSDGAWRGYAFPALGSISESPVSIEVWSKRIQNGKLVTDGRPYAWHVFPWVQYLKPGPRTFENANLGAQFTGEAYENQNWFDGPLNDWPEDSDRVYQWLPTATLPTASCGYQTLVAS